MKKVNFLIFVPILLAFSVQPSYAVLSKSVTVNVGSSQASTLVNPDAFYCQGDPQWNSDGCNIPYEGCGPTSLAIVLASYGDTADTPDVVDKTLRSFGQRNCGDATLWTFLENPQVQSKYGLAVTAVKIDSDGGLNVNNALEFLNTGYLIVGESLHFPCSGGTFTNCPHIFVVRDIDPFKYYLKDPQGCSYIQGGPIKPEQQTWSRDKIPFYYAYAIKKL